MPHEEQLPTQGKLGLEFGLELPSMYYLGGVGERGLISCKEEKSR